MLLLFWFRVSMGKELANLWDASHKILLQMSMYRKKSFFIKPDIVEILYFSHGHNFFHSKLKKKKSSYEKRHLCQSYTRLTHLVRNRFVCLNGLKSQNWFGKNYLVLETQKNLKFDFKINYYLILKL